MNDLSPILILSLSAVLVLVAFLYASVGHGGASGYLGLMALFSLPIYIMKPTALLLNIFVSGVAFIFFKSNHHFKLKLFLPFALTSIPAAFLGGYLNISASLYKQILAVFLIIAIFRMLGYFGKKDIKSREINLPLALTLGLAIGFFSGMIGIGGGIILSPVIILLGYGDMKQAAAVSALFIFVNSISGIFGFVLNGGQLPEIALYLVPSALIGGIFGAFMGSKRLSHKQLSYILSLVLLLASIKLLMI